MKKEILKFFLLTLVLGTFLNFLVDSQNIANFFRNIPVVGHLMRELELDHAFMNLPFLHHDVTKIKFLLYTDKNPYTPHELNMEDPLTFQNVEFDGNRSVKILIHGYLQSGHSWDFPISLKNAYLDLGRQTGDDGETSGIKYNVICVDWSILSKEMIYFVSAVYTEKVGKRVGQFIALLRHSNFIRNYTAVHMVGFSLGGHVAGVAGHLIQSSTNGTKRIGRISGLDPAGPGFESVPLSMKLDPGDADFVDVIHSNAGSLYFAQWGTWDSLGKIDFFVNGGSRQPACDISLLTEFTLPRKIACNHLKAAEYFRRTIEGEVMRGCLWTDDKNQDDPSSDVCTQLDNGPPPSIPCSIDKDVEDVKTARMGEYCDPNSEGRFYLDAN